MPYIHVSIGKKITPEQEQKLGRELGQAVTVIPNKMFEKTMVHIEDNCRIYRGGHPTPCAFLETRFNERIDIVPLQAYTTRVYDLFESVLDIPKDQFYVNAIVADNWGSNGIIK